MTRKSFDEIELVTMVYTVKGKEQLIGEVDTTAADGANNQVLEGSAFIDAIAKADIKAIDLLKQTMTAEQLKEVLAELSPEERAKYEAAIKEGDANGFQLDNAAERKATVSQAKETDINKSGQEKQ